MACYWYRDAAWLFKSLVEFNDPIQGQPGNCTFVAALSSIAWVNPSIIVDISSTVTDSGGNVLNKVYKFTFYNAGNGSAQDVFVTDYLKGDAGNLCWVKSKTENEIWPGIYEKAYAAFRLGTYGTWDFQNKSGNPIDQPDNWNDGGGMISESTQWPQFGLTPLKNILGLLNERLTTITPTTLPMDIWNGLYSGGLPLLYCATPSGTYYSRYRLRRSIVAWTLPNAAAPIVSDHTYSVLGLIRYTKDLSDDTKNYIVLRNPTGSSQPPTNSPKTNFCGILIDGTNGVFAISAKEFRDNFTAYGWVQ